MCGIYRRHSPISMKDAKIKNNRYVKKNNISI